MEGIDRKFIERVGSGLESDVRRFEDAKADFASTFESNPNYAMQWKAATVILAQARYEVAVNLLPGNEGQIDWDDEETIVKFAQNLYHWRDRNLDTLDFFRFEGRSTSAMSNLVEDAETKAKLDLLGKLAKS